jgi:GntR family transcriptional regulator, histidine utilization repressor
VTRVAPLFERIGTDIETRIMSGAWPPGHRIPVEHQLMADYGCSRMTVSKALSRLSERGLIDRRTRAGSFVAAPRAHRATLEIPDIPAAVTATGARHEHALISRAIRPANAVDRVELAISAGPVLAVACLHFADGRPFAFEAREINLALVPAAADVDFSIEPPGSWLLDHVAWSEADHRIAAVAANAETARLLHLQPDAACLHLERWTWHNSRRKVAPRITHVCQIYPAGDFALTGHFSAG